MYVSRSGGTSSKKLIFPDQFALSNCDKDLSIIVRLCNIINQKGFDSKLSSSLLVFGTPNRPFGQWNFPVVLGVAAEGYLNHVRPLNLCTSVLRCLIRCN